MVNKLVTLDEIEEYENELKRAHAENRAPRLRNPHDVFADTLGNGETCLEEVSAEDENKANAARDKLIADDHKNDDRLRQVIRKNTQATPNPDKDPISVSPYQAPDPDNYKAPQTDTQKEIADRQADHALNYGQKFDDSFSDVNHPNTDDEGNVLGDSVNRVMTRKMTTFSPDELIRENERNSVPVPDRYRLENPPQVVQQSNPVTGEAPAPIPGEHYGADYAVNTREDNGNPEREGKPVYADEVAATAIKFPHPEHVIGDETGTTREPSRDNETDVNEPADGVGEFPTEVPLTQGQVAQGAVKRPDHFNPPTDNEDTNSLSDNVLAGTYSNLPVDTPPGLRSENEAQKAGKENAQATLPGNVDNVVITDEQKKLVADINEQREQEQLGVLSDKNRDDK
jgi:hypothetical protein